MNTDCCFNERAVFAFLVYELCVFCDEFDQNMNFDSYHKVLPYVPADAKQCSV